MAVFVDTSALYALVSANDQDHLIATRIWDILEEQAAFPKAVLLPPKLLTNQE